MELYPFCFVPNLHPVIWGGNRLCRFKGLDPVDAPIGESWEVSTVEGSVSIISNGQHGGRPLTEVIAEDPDAVLGYSVSRKYNGRLPLLVKFIDAKKDLSIQVHPDDAMAQRVHGKMGKSEMWYVLKADPGSFLYAGFRKEITPDEYKQRVAEGTITDVLARHEVRPGDVFCLPDAFMLSVAASCSLRFSSHPTSHIVFSTTTVWVWMANRVSCIPTWQHRLSTSMLRTNIGHWSATVVIGRHALSTLLISASV